MPGWTLGQTSSRYETSGRGPGTVSTGAGDHGGVSYGSYQLSTNESTVQEFLRFNRSIGASFTGLSAGTSVFRDRWHTFAAADPEGFHRAQHDFIQHKFYDVQMQRLQDAGIDLSQRGPAVQDMPWSTSVQFRDRTRSIMQGALDGKDLATLSDVDIVSAVQDHKRDHNNTLFRSSPTWWPGLLARAANEKQDLVDLARSYGGDQAPGRHRAELTPTQHETLKQFKAQTGEQLAARGLSEQQVEQLGLAAVRHLEAMPCQTDAQRFLFSNDGQRIAVRHATGQVTEFGVESALSQTFVAPDSTVRQPVVPSAAQENATPAFSR